ncbi:MAG: metallophosphoesterase [Chthoniobacteraceae bacterium]|nr:metallophosphoesterase [Chthoniobacteraceae bacterium]
MNFFLGILGLLAAADFFLWWQSARLLGRRASLAARVTLHGFFFLQTGVVVLFLSTVFSLRGWHLLHALPTSVFLVIYLWHLVLVPLALGGHFLGITAATAAGAAHRVRQWLLPPPPALPAENPPTGGPGGLSRREFLGTLAALTPPLLTFPLSAYAGAQSKTFRIRRIEVPLAGLPPALDGATIVHLSDLHIGQFTHGRILRRIVEATNAFHADLTVFTGDLINGDFADLPEAFQMLRALQPAPFLCEGNHDVGFNRAGFERIVKGAGLRLLVDESGVALVRGCPVQLLGLRWEGPQNWQNRHNEAPLAASMRHLLGQRIPGAFPILLAHHPHAWDYSGDIPLTLCGHTHGGQLMADEQHGFGPLMFRYWTGLYSRPGQALVVSNGIGNWFPLRTNAPAELVHLTLRRA